MSHVDTRKDVEQRMGVVVEVDFSLYRGIKRWLLLALCCWFTLTTSGVVLGWSSLVLLLKDQHVYSDNCTPPQNDEGTDGGLICSGQEERLNLVYTLGIMANYFSNLPCGWFLDRFGPRSGSALGAILFSLGAFLFAFPNFLGLDGYLLGFALLGFGGPCVQLPLFQFANLFPAHESTIISILTALFDASTMVFLFFKLMYDWTAVELGTLFTALGINGIFILIAVLLLWPNKPFIKLRASDITLLQADAQSKPNYGTLHQEGDVESRTESKVKENVFFADYSFKQMIFSPEFMVIVAFVSVHILRLNFVIGTIEMQMQYAYEADKETISWHINLFNAILPFGFVIIPLGTYLMEQRGFYMTFTVINLFGIIYGWLILYIDNFIFFIVMTFFFAVSRQLVYATFFAYLAANFGVKSFGTLSGINNLITTLVSSLQYPLGSYPVDNQQGNFSSVNLLLLFSVIICFVFVLVILKNAKLISERKGLSWAESIWYQWFYPLQPEDILPKEEIRPKMVGPVPSTIVADT